MRPVTPTNLAPDFMDAYLQRITDFASYCAEISKLRTELRDSFTKAELRAQVLACDAARLFSDAQIDLILADLSLSESALNIVLDQRASVLDLAKSQVAGNEESRELFSSELHHDLAGGLTADLPNQVEELIAQFRRIRELKIIDGEASDLAVLALEVALRLKMRERYFELKAQPEANAAELIKLFDFMLHGQEFFLSESDLPESLGNQNLKRLVKQYQQAYRLDAVFNSQTDELEQGQYRPGHYDQEVLAFWNDQILVDRLAQLRRVDARSEFIGDLEVTLFKAVIRRLYGESNPVPVLTYDQLPIDLFQFKQQHRIENLAEAQQAYRASCLLHGLIETCLDSSANLDLLQTRVNAFNALWAEKLDEPSLRTAFEKYAPTHAAVFERVLLAIKNPEKFIQVRHQRTQALVDIVAEFSEKLTSQVARKACAELADRYHQGYCDWDNALKSLVQFQSSHPQLHGSCFSLSANLTRVAQFAYAEKIFEILTLRAKATNAEERKQAEAEILRIIDLTLCNVKYLTGACYVAPVQSDDIKKLLINLLHLENFLGQIERSEEREFLAELQRQCIFRLNESYQHLSPDLKTQTLEFLCHHKKTWLSKAQVDAGDTNSEAYLTLVALPGKLAQIPALKKLVAACFAVDLTFGFLEAEVEEFKRVLAPEPTEAVLAELLALAGMQGEALLPSVLAAIQNPAEYRKSRKAEYSKLHALIKNLCAADLVLQNEFSQVWQSYLKGNLNYDNALKNIGILFAASSTHADDSVKLLKSAFTKPEHYRGLLLNVFYVLEHQAQNRKALQKALDLYRKFGVTGADLEALITAEPAETRDQQAKLFKRLQRFEAFQVKLDKIREEDRTLFADIQSKLVEHLKEKLGREFDERSVLEGYISKMSVPAILGRELPTQFLREKKIANAYSSLAEVQRVLATLRVVESYLREDVKTQANTYAEYQKEGHWRTRKNVKSAFDILDSAQAYLRGEKTFAEYESDLKANMAQMQSHSTLFSSNLHERLTKAAAPDVNLLFAAMDQADQSKVDEVLALFFKDFVPVGNNPDLLALQLENYFTAFLRDCDFDRLLEWYVSCERYSLNSASPQLFQAVHAALQQKILDQILAAQEPLDVAIQVEALYKHNIRLGLLFVNKSDKPASSALDELARKFPMLEEGLREYQRACELCREIGYLRLGNTNNSLTPARALNQLAAAYAVAYKAAKEKPAEDLVAGSGSNKAGNAGRLMSFVAKGELSNLDACLTPFLAEASTVAELHLRLSEVLPCLLAALVLNPAFKEVPRDELVVYAHEYVLSLIDKHPLTIQLAQPIDRLIRRINQDSVLNPKLAEEIAPYGWRNPATQASFQRLATSEDFFKRDFFVTHPVQLSDAVSAWDPIADLIQARAAVIAALKSGDQTAPVLLEEMMALRHFSLHPDMYSPLVSLSDTADYLAVMVAAFNVQDQQCQISITPEQIQQLQKQDRQLRGFVIDPGTLSGQAILEAIKRELTAYLLTRKYTAKEVGGFLRFADISKLDDQTKNLVLAIRRCELHEEPGFINYELGLDQVRALFLVHSAFKKSKLVRVLPRQELRLSELQEVLLVSQARGQLHELVESLKVSFSVDQNKDHESFGRVENALRRLVGYGRVNLADLFVGKSPEELLDLTQKLAGFSPENIEAQEARQAVLIALTQRPEMQVSLHRYLFKLMSDPGSFSAAASLLDAFNPGLSGDNLAAHLRRNAVLVFTEATTQELLGFWSAFCDFMPYAEVELSESSLRTSVFEELLDHLSEILRNRVSQGDLSGVSKQAFVQAYYAKWIAGQLRGSSQTVLPDVLRTGFELIAKEYANLTPKDAEGSQKFARIDENFREKPSIEPVIEEAKKFLASQVELEGFFAACAQVMASLYEEFFKQGWQLDPVQAFVCVERLVSDWVIQAKPGFAALVLLGARQDHEASLNSQTRSLEQQIRAFCLGEGFDISSLCDPIFVIQMRKALVQNGGPVVPMGASRDQESESEPELEPEPEPESESEQAGSKVSANPASFFNARADALSAERAAELVVQPGSDTGSSPESSDQDEVDVEAQRPVSELTTS